MTKSLNEELENENARLQGKVLYGLFLYSHSFNGVFLFVCLFVCF